jgi:aldehyde dehydrogenase (NAD+)
MLIVHWYRTIEPTILLNPPLDSDIMTEEIFGPILPIITVRRR